jgi:RNA-binding protein PNO1
MPAPTALRNKSDVPAEDQPMAESTPLPAEEEQTELLDMQALPSDTPAAPQITADAPVDDQVMTDESGRPRFAPAIATPIAFRRELRKVPVPPHRMTPLKNSWPK